jgi:hypothetical protein
MDGPLRNRVCRCVAVIVLSSLAASPAAGQVIPANATVVVPAATPPTNIQHLKIGDWYEVTVQRGDASRQLSGTLVKTTDRWIVLFTNVEGRTERGVPVMSKVPYVNRLFKNVGIGRATTYHWLPREATTIRGRTMANKEIALPTPQGDFPPADAQSTVEIRQDNQAAEHRGKLTFQHDQLTCRSERLVAKERRVPVLGAIPVVGQAFRSEEFVSEEQTYEIALDAVLCINDDSAEADYEALSANH